MTRKPENDLPSPAYKYQMPLDNDPTWRNLAKQAMREAQADLYRKPRHMLDHGDPNHPSHDRLFGYDREAFMAKQYAVQA
jgi:hypothetical protein